jgi:phage terminase small subunit
MQKNAEKCSSTEKSEQLSSKQEQFIAALIAGNTIAVACKTAGIAERTAYNWLKQPAFKQALQTAKQEVFNDKLESLRDGVDLAISALERNLTAPDPSVQVRAAHIWLQHAIQVGKMEELESRLQELEEALKASHV